MAASSRDDKTSWESDIREQEARAKVSDTVVPDTWLIYYLQAAEDKYSREVVAHAESIKIIESMKTELEELRTSTRTAKHAADTVQAKLTMAEDSWKLQKSALDKEIVGLQARY